MSTFSYKQERRHFQTHYDWTAVLVGTFQYQQSLPGQPVTVTAWCQTHSGAALPHFEHVSILAAPLLWCLTAITVRTVGSSN